MNITEAEERCTELSKKIRAIEKEYNFDSYSRFRGKAHTKHLKDELDILLTALIKAKQDTEIDLPA